VKAVKHLELKPAFCDSPEKSSIGDHHWDY
jgi:hypothetical protein